MPHGQISKDSLHVVAVKGDSYCVLDNGDFIDDIRKLNDQKDKSIRPLLK
jgi:hypothetical protein